jgi:hypothetical protein
MQFNFKKLVTLFTLYFLFFPNQIFAQIPIVIPIPLERGNNNLQSDTVAISAYLKTGRILHGRSLVKIYHEHNLIKRKSVISIEKEKILPSETDSIIADFIVGYPDSLNWNFKLLDGKISLFAYLPFFKLEYFSFLEKDTKRYKYSIDTLRKLVRDNKTSLLYCQTVGNMQPDPKLAIDEYNNPISLYHKEIDSLYNLCKKRNGNLERNKVALIEFFKKAKIYTKADSLYELAISTNDISKKHELLNQALQFNKYKPEIYFELGNNEITSGPEQAYKDLILALKYSENDDFDNKVRNKIKLLGRKYPNYKSNDD